MDRELPLLIRGTMADRYDPKVSVRPPGERRQAQGAVPDNDPLAELARIVSGRNALDPAPDGKTDDPLQYEPSGDLAQDLEAELLNDLQASFAAVRETLASPTPSSSEPSVAQPGSPDAPRGTGARMPPSLSQEATNAPVVLRPPLPSEPERVPDIEPLEKLLNEMVRPVVAEHQERAAVPPPGQPAPTAPARVVSPREPIARMPEQRDAVIRLPDAREPVLRPLPETAVPPTPTFLREPSSERTPVERAETSVVPLRPPTPPVPARPPAPSSAVAVRPASRWDRPAETTERSSRFAPPRPTGRTRPPVREPEPPAPQPELPNEPYLEEPPASYLDDFEPEAVIEEEFAPEELEAPLPAEDEFPPFPEDELAEHGRRRSRRTLAVVGILAVVALLGGAAFYWLQPTIAGTANPPIITADPGPTKVPPEASAAVADADPQSKIIYDRVNENRAGEGTTLVTPGDAPIADVRTDDTASNPITRVIIPGGPGFDGPMPPAQGAPDAAASAAPADTDSSTALGPRKVRTVVVRPDGTIVSSEATAVDDNGAVIAAPQGEIVPNDPGPLPPVRTDMDAVLEGETLAVNPDPLGTSSTSTAPAGTVPASGTVESLPVTANPPPAQRPAQPAQTQVASAPPSRPVEAAPARPAQRTAPAPSATGMLVQVSSQRSQEAAASTYRDLQARYPSILGPFQPNIQRADLGERGVYYRVRVGPFSAADAQRLCDDLKRAGGDCLIAR